MDQLPYTKEAERLWKYNDQAFFTQEAISTICETTINSMNEFAAGQPLSNEIMAQAP